MSVFARRLVAARPVDASARRWVFAAYDQLSDRIGPLARLDPGEAGLVIVESGWKAARRPYHKQKLAMLLANQRHFALEQAARGVAVRHVSTAASYGEALADVVRETGPLLMMRPAERELRADLDGLVRAGRLSYEPHEGFLTSGDLFRASQRPGAPWRMDAFYRAARRDTGILMEGGRPVGGKFSFDAANRKPWSGRPAAPEAPQFEPDAVTREVGDLVEQVFADHPGRLDLSAFPATRADAERAWRWAKEHALPHFGPYEDAMSRRSRGLFHTRLSALLNLHRLLPADVVHEAAALDAPIASREGFVRQVLGWREFVRHVHEATDGFRVDPSSSTPPTGLPDDGARPNQLEAENPLPPAYWRGGSGLGCLDHVVDAVWDTGYSHHIERLMVLSNLATLLDVTPRELTDWFWAAYVDAFDWVVEPNVLGMGTFALGDRMTTKPYVSGAAYIDRMSDFCDSCPFRPGVDCPITPLYWAFLARHRAQLSGNPRLRVVLAALARRDPERKANDAATYRHVSELLAAGEPLAPSDPSLADRGARS